jgi:hypothetical protein
MSTNQTTTPTTTPTNNQTPTQNKEDKPNTTEEKPATCIKSFFKSYLFYFLMASGTAFTSYMVYRRMNKN